MIPLIKEELKLYLLKDEEFLLQYFFETITLKELSKTLKISIEGLRKQIINLSKKIIRIHRNLDTIFSQKIIEIENIISNECVISKKDLITIIGQEYICIIYIYEYSNKKNTFQSKITDWILFISNNFNKYLLNNNNTELNSLFSIKTYIDIKKLNITNYNLYNYVKVLKNFTICKNKKIITVKKYAKKLEYKLILLILLI